MSQSWAIFPSVSYKHSSWSFSALTGVLKGLEMNVVLSYRQWKFAKVKICYQILMDPLNNWLGVRITEFKMRSIFFICSVYMSVYSK